MPTLAHIQIFPVKSLDPVSVEQAILLPSGALEFDRRYALRDTDGNFINGKSTSALHVLRSTFDAVDRRLTLRVEGSAETLVFDMDVDLPRLSAWLSDYLHMKVQCVENDTAGFPDDTISPGPTVISTATLGTIAGWFPGITIGDARLRFRANLEVDGVEPFWEDRLVKSGSGVVRFQIGPAVLLGTNVCQRCAVPSRDARTGAVTAGFGPTFVARRQQSLPVWAPADSFNHYYRLAVNTRVENSGRMTLRLGDEVSLLDLP
jgi:uncharacterized protein YcbX